MSGITFSILGAPELLPLKTNQPTSTMVRQDRPKSILGSFKNGLSRKQNNVVQDHPHPHAVNAPPPTRRPAGHSANPFHSASSFDAPPPYSPASTTPPYSPASIQTPRIHDNPDIRSPQSPVADDAYAFLGDFDTIFLIDDSGSMAGGLWRQTTDAVMMITPICTAYDADGIDIFFLNHPQKYPNITNADTVRNIFESVKPGGATPTGKRLNKMFQQYFARYEAQPRATKPINIICITDGAPSDDVEGVLIQAAKKLDRLEAPAWQVGVQFFQVGSDPDATRHLKELDDDLADIAHDRDMRDMVDTVPYIGQNGTTLSGAGILKVVLGAVTRRLDRRSRELHR